VVFGVIEGAMAVGRLAADRDEVGIDLTGDAQDPANTTNARENTRTSW
jgi:hypothetical protein